MEQSPPAGDLAWTGERLVTTCHRPLVYEHLHRYAVAFGLAKGKRVLDIACGEGYGANLLAVVASKVIGVDLDAGTIAHARAKYQRRNLHFAEGSCTEIPCEDHSIDLVASFETIEHISQHDAFLSEIKRVLAPGGILVISSPHKAEYQKVSEAANPFHEAELDHDEFVQLITKRFKHCVAAKQRLVIGSWIAPDEPSAQVSTATFRGWFDGIDIESGVHRGLYSIAVCSDQALPVFDLGMFENLHDSADTWNLLDTYDTPAQISARLAELAKAGEEKAALVLQLQEEAGGKAQQLAEFQKELEQKSQHVAQIEREGAQLKAKADEGLKHAAELQRLNERQSQHLEQLKNQSETANDRLARAQNDLLDARWEALTLRGTLLRKTESAETPYSRILDLENRVETTMSERDHMRNMLTALQNDLDRERLAGEGRQSELRTTQNQLEAAQVELKKLAKELRSEQKQMERLRASMSRKLILPFGKSQRKLQQLTASRRADD